MRLPGKTDFSLPFIGKFGGLDAPHRALNRVVTGAGLPGLPDPAEDFEDTGRQKKGRSLSRSGGTPAPKSTTLG